MHHRWPGPSPDSGSSPVRDVDPALRRSRGVATSSLRSPWPSSFHTTSWGCSRTSRAVRACRQCRWPGPETIEPAVAAGKDRLRHAAETAKAGEDHWPCRMLPARRVVGPDQLARCVLSRAMKLGASGAGTVLCNSSTPLEVPTSSSSPAAVTEQQVMLCGTTPNRASCRSARGFRPGRLPGRQASVPRQTTSQRLVTSQSRLGPRPAASSRSNLRANPRRRRRVSFLRKTARGSGRRTRAKHKQAAEVDAGRVLASQPAPLLVAEKTLPPATTGGAVGLRAEPGDPADALGRSRLPAAALGLELPDVPLAGRLVTSDTLFRDGEPPHCGSSAARCRPTAGRKTRRTITLGKPWDRQRGFGRRSLHGRTSAEVWKGGWRRFSC